MAETPVGSSGRATWLSLGRIGGLIAIALVFLTLGYFIRWGCAPVRIEGPAVADKTTEYTCPMHPEVRSNKPGLCPKCGMPLVPVTAGPTEVGLGPRQIAFSDEAVKLMEVETAPVERRAVSRTLRMVGKVTYNERKLAYITAWVGGRLDRLHVDYTGLSVRQGEHMVDIYSPELLSAQEELLAAKRAVDALGASEAGIVRQTTQATVTAVREKLRLLGLSAEQIAEIESTGKTREHLTINAPVGGVVIEKNALQGMYVETGTRIYTIADLSEVWVMLDAYESDLEWIRYGQPVEFTTVAYPGETFGGTVVFIDPMLSEKTRTAKVRVNVANPLGKLKPDMFVKAEVKAEMGAGGAVVAPNVAGKWICPMHPDVVAEQAGTCHFCGMPLESAEKLGYVPATGPAELPLVIPGSAALWTGTRAIVYVQLPGREKPTFEGREIELGPRADGYYLVRQGLDEGDRVAVRGNFKIDSAVQIAAKPSMMSPGGQAVDHTGHGTAPAPSTTTSAPTGTAEAPRTFQAQLAVVYEAYLATHAALAADQFDAARAAVSRCREALGKVDMTLLSGEAHAAWMPHQTRLAERIDAAAQAKDMATLRTAFAPLSQEFISLTRAVRNPLDKLLRQVHCPMVFDNKGADWLQTAETVANPYDPSMPTCGVFGQTFAPAGK